MALDQPQESDPAASAGKEAGERAGDSFKVMPLGDHLEELRRNLLLALAGVGVALVVSVLLSFRIIAWLQAPLLEAQHALGFPPQTVATDATFGFMTVYLPVSLIAAVVFAAPWIVYQGWRFIESGLYDHEKKAASLLAPFSAAMTLLGVLFARYILLPVCVVFFLKFSTLYPEVDPGEPGLMVRLLSQGGASPSRPAEGAEAGGEGSAQADEAQTLSLPRVPVLEAPPVDAGEGSMWIDAKQGRLKVMLGGQVRVLTLTSNRLVSPLPDLPKQVKFAALLMLGVVVALHLPVLMLVIGWTGLIDPDVVAKQRKYAVFGCFVIGAVLTPADLMSMFVLAGPMYGLFEFGLVLMRLVDRSPEEPE